MLKISNIDQNLHIIVDFTNQNYYSIDQTLLKKINAFSLILPYFSRVLFTISENATKYKFSQEMLNSLSNVKFMGSHLAFYD